MALESKVVQNARAIGYTVFRLQTEFQISDGNEKFQPDFVEIKSSSSFFRFQRGGIANVSHFC